MRVGEHDGFAGANVFVNQDVVVAALDRTQHPFAFEHQGQDVADIVVSRMIFRHQPAEKSLGVIARQRLRRTRGGRLVFRAPERKRLDVFVSRLPRLFAEIFPKETVRLADQKSVKVFAGYELSSRPRADMCPRFDFPVGLHG